MSASGMSSGTVLGRADLKHSSAVGWTHYPPVGFEAPQPIVPSSALLALLRAAELDEMELNVVPVLLGRDGGCSTTCPRRTSSSARNAA